MTQQFRTVMYAGDPDRDWNVIWTRGDYISPSAYGFFVRGDEIWDPVQLVGANGTAYAVKPFTIRQQDWFENCFYRTFRIHATTPAGQYQIRLNRKMVGDVEVRRGGLSPVYNLLIKSPALKMQAGNTYSGYGCIVKGNVTVAPNCTIEGLTVVDGLTEGLAENCVFKDCTFIRGQFGGMVDWSRPKEYVDHGALYINCRFLNCQVTGCTSGAFVNCEFIGRVIGAGGGNGHNFVTERGKRLCMFNCLFDRTDRGPILRTAWGDNSDNLYCGLELRDITATTNGNEAFCIENNANRFDRNMILGLRTSNVANHLQIWNTPADGNLIANSWFCKNCTVHLAGIEPQNHNAVMYCGLSEPVKLNGNGSKAKDTTTLYNWQA